MSHAIGERRTKKSPRTPQLLRTRIGLTDMPLSDELRRKYLAWVGTNRSVRSCLEDVSGRKFQKVPNWMSNGNIPQDWRERMIRQMAESATP